MRHTYLKQRFVDYIPESLESGVLYISMEYATAVHRCCCGCGEEVVTPFTPTDWKMTFDGETVSLSPSIGNWNFTCRSHYFIRRGQVIRASNWDEKQVKDNRQEDNAAKEGYYSKREEIDTVQPTPDIIPQTRRLELDIKTWLACKGNNLVQRMTQWLRKL